MISFTSPCQTISETKSVSEMMKKNVPTLDLSEFGKEMSTWDVSKTGEMH